MYTILLAVFEKTCAATEKKRKKSCFWDFEKKTLKTYKKRTYSLLGSRVVSVLDSGAEGPGSNRKLFTPIVPLSTKQQNWQQPS